MLFQQLARSFGPISVCKQHIRVYPRHKTARIRQFLDRQVDEPFFVPQHRLGSNVQHIPMRRQFKRLVQKRALDGQTRHALL